MDEIRLTALFVGLLLVLAGAVLMRHDHQQRHDKNDQGFP